VLGALDRFVADIRFGARVLARHPLRTAIAVGTLSLAIGANTAVFSALNAVLFRPFPFPAADRAVLVVERLRSGGGTSPTIPEILDLRARSRTLEAITFFDTRDFQLDGGPEPLRVAGARVDPGFLPFVGARPAHGRLFGEADSAEGSPGVLLLGDGFWRRHFGADPAVVGRPLVVNGAAHTIAGVLASDFSLGFLSGEPEIYVPYPLTRDYTLRTAEFANVRRVQPLARIAPGVSRQAVSAELETIAAALAGEHPALYADFGGAANFVIDVEPLREAISAGTRPPLLLLFGAVGVVLLIGCVNAAQFLLSHAIEREPEVALRSALGASRGRLVSQFLSETLVLVFAAALLGVVQAVWLVQALRIVLPGMLMVGQIELDATVLVFAGVVAAVTTLLCGVVPALRFARARLRASLDVRSTPGARSRSRHVLVAVQVALSIVLLVQAVLLVRTLQIQWQSQSGFSAEAVTAMRIRGMAAGANLGTTYARYLERIAATPGLAGAAMTSSPLPGWPSTPFSIPDRPDDAATRSRQSASYQIVSPEYFAVIRIPLHEGRTFEPTDTAMAPPVAIVNEELARRAFPGTSPLGRTIRAGGTGPRDATMTIVGVVGNVRRAGQTDDVPQIYVSYLQQSEPNMIVMVRPHAGPAPIDAVKRAIWSVEPRQAVFDIRALDDVLAQSVQRGRVIAILISSVAALALAMSMAGVFAVVAYMTSRRHKEIALRRAIGAQAGDVVWLLSGQTFRWAVAGLAAGVGAAVLVSRALRASVGQLTDLEPALLAMTCVAYLAVVAAAMLLPAARALRVDPSTALRAE
jgi:predicted permease